MKTAYPQIKGTCSIRLYSNIPFDNTYKNHSMISHLFTYNDTAMGTLTEQQLIESFLDRKDYTKIQKPYYYPRYDLTGDFNFDFTNGLVASVTLELTSAQTNANYLRLTCGNDVYYYFITHITQNNADTYTLTLELDVLMTYQDEFLQGMKDIPVFTTRKHCHRFTDDGLMPYGADLKTTEEMFAGVKPSFITRIQRLHFKNESLNRIEDVKWLYICVATPTISGEGASEVLYTCRNKTYPFSMLVLPINVNSVTYQSIDVDEDDEHEYSVTFNHEKIIKAITKLIDDGSVHGAKISPYPPFSPNLNLSGITLVNGNLTLTGNVTEIASNLFYRMTINNNNLIYSPDNIPEQSTLFVLMRNGAMLLSVQNDLNYEYDALLPASLGISNSEMPTINSPRYREPKLLFSPFRKYLINAQYSSQGYEFFPELIYSEISTGSLSQYFKFDTTATGYIGDNNFYTKVSSNVDGFNNYKYEKLGLASSVNYIFPCGENALDVFNSTQANSYYQSKIASGVTSGLAVAGGALSIIVGSTMTAGSGGALTPMGMGMITGGATGIASGVAGVVSDVTSMFAKQQDLKNTPDTINISGSNYITDDAITENTNGLPYIVVYDASSVVYENATDFFYNYGYQVARDCYFNTELKYDFTDSIDNNLFGRDIFNYIQINDDITNKINADIPHIVKQKLSSIFNSGITLWSFFTFSTLWKNPSVSLAPNIDRWFMKHELDNTEVDYVAS